MNPANKKESVDSKNIDLLLEQYKLYVETMEKLVERRQTAHSVLLTANAFLMTMAGFFVKDVKPPVSLPSGIAVVAVAVAGILLSFTWQKLSQHYGLMNRAKFEVIHALERQLPTAPFLDEWHALGEGKDPRRYQSMATIESTIPKIFIGCYTVLALFALFVMTYK